VIADEANAPRVRDLSHKPGAGVNDVTISSFGTLLLPALSHSGQANPLFVGHVLLAFGVHIAQTYGGIRPVSRPVGVGSHHGRSDARTPAQGGEGRLRGAAIMAMSALGQKQTFAPQ